MSIVGPNLRPRMCLHCRYNHCIVALPLIYSMRFYCLPSCTAFFFQLHVSFSCSKYWDNINHCQASESYSNLWELPLYQYQKGPYQASTSDLMDPENPYDILKAEFKRRYKGNRAPLGIWTHTSTGYLKQK